MIWFIISIVTGAALFGGQPHQFSSSKHFATEMECVAYIPNDRAELMGELRDAGLMEPYGMTSHCEQDSAFGEPL